MTDGDPGLANAIATVFPDTTHLLCRWHHKQNIRTNCSKFFATTELWEAFQSVWLHCIDAPTEAEFKTRWAAMRASFGRSQRESIQYLQKNWCGVKLPKIAKFGTDQAFHLFNTTTSRAEGAHHSIKDALHTSNGDFKYVADAIASMLINRQTAQHDAMNTDRITYSRVYYDNPIFSKCVGIISTVAIIKVQKQFKLISPNRDIGQCTYAFIRITGLPCKHFLYEHITADPNWKLNPHSDFHSHWAYVMYPHDPPRDETSSLFQI